MQQNRMFNKVHPERRDHYIDQLFLQADGVVANSFEQDCYEREFHVMTSSTGNIYSVTGP